MYAYGVLFVQSSVWTKYLRTEIHRPHRLHYGKLLSLCYDGTSTTKTLRVERFADRDSSRAASASRTESHIAACSALAGERQVYPPSPHFSVGGGSLVAFVSQSRKDSSLPKYIFQLLLARVYSTARCRIKEPLSRFVAALRLPTLGPTISSFPLPISYHLGSVLQPPITSVP